MKVFILVYVNKNMNCVCAIYPIDATLPDHTFKKIYTRYFAGTYRNSCSWQFV